MTVNEALEKMKFETRLIDYFMKEGRITPQDYEAYLKSLGDLSDKSTTIDLTNFNESSDL